MSATYDELPFSEGKQDAMCGHLVYNEQFFKQANARIEPAWFNDPFIQKIYKAKLNFHKKFKRSPTIDELRETPEFTLEEQVVRKKLLTKLEGTRKSMERFRLDALSSELTDWLRARLYHVGMEKSGELFNNSRFDEAYTAADSMVRDIKEASFDNEHEVSYADPLADIEAAQVSTKGALTFGHPLIDKLILPESDTGCMLPGDTTIILAPTNVGKTTCMVTAACANIKKGKSVLFLQHEDSESNVKMKLLCCMLRVSRKELFELYKTEEGVQKIIHANMFFQRFLKHVRFVKAGGTVEEVETIYRRKQDERVAKTGKPFDLHVNDYPAKLTTALARGGWPRRQIDDHVYDYFVQLGGEYGTHNLLAIQTNREGAKINKNVSQDSNKRLIVGEDVQESFGVPQKASNLLSINRDAIAKMRDYVTFCIDKSRTSETGIGVICKSDYGRGTTHAPDLGSCYYHGTSVLTDRDDLDELVGKYDGQCLPEHIFNK